MNVLTTPLKVDWDKVQLVVLKGDCSVIVLVTNNQDDAEDSSRHFCGILLREGIYSNTFVKQQYEPYFGSITLQND